MSEQQIVSIEDRLLSVSFISDFVFLWNLNSNNLNPGIGSVLFPDLSPVSLTEIVKDQINYLKFLQFLTFLKFLSLFNGILWWKNKTSLWWKKKTSTEVLFYWEQSAVDCVVLRGIHPLEDFIPQVDQDLNSLIWPQRRPFCWQRSSLEISEGSFHDLQNTCRSITSLCLVRTEN